MSQNPIWLDDLMARDVALEWFESVALIQAVCKQIIEEGEEPDSFPTTADVVLNADGSIGILEIPPGEAAIPAAARMIISLGSGPFPVQLRLALSQTAAGGPDTPTLRAFSQTLRFFERPNPQDILRQLYQRAAMAPAKTQAYAEVSPISPVQANSPARATTPKETTTKEPTTRETTPRETTPKQATPKQATPEASKKGLRTGRLAAAVVLVAVAAGSLMFFGSGDSSAQLHTAMGTAREKLLWPASGSSSKAVDKPAQPAGTEARVTRGPLKSGAHEAARRPAAANARGESPLPSPRDPIVGEIELPLLKRGPFEADQIRRVDEIVYPQRESATVQPDGKVYSSTDTGVPTAPAYLSQAPRPGFESYGDSQRCGGRRAPHRDGWTRRTSETENRPSHDPRHHAAQRRQSVAVRSGVDERRTGEIPVPRCDRAVTRRVGKPPCKSVKT